MTNMAQTLVDVERILSDLPQEIHGTARMVALLRALGVNDTQRIADLCRVSRRMVQKSANPSSSVSEPQFAEANPSSPKTNPGSPNEPQFASRAPAPARIESPSGIVITSGSRSAPSTPLRGKAARDYWTKQFNPEPAHDGGVREVDGRIELHGDTLAIWLEKFGSQDRLDSALGTVRLQRGSSDPIYAQVQRQLNFEHGRFLDRTSFKRTPTASQPPANGIRAAIARRRAAEAAAEAAA